MGDEVCVPTDVLDHRTESNGEGIGLTRMNQEARTGNLDRRWSVGRKNRAGGTGVLTGSLYELIRSALNQIRSKTKNQTENQDLAQPKTKSVRPATPHSRGKILPRKNRYQGAGIQNDVPNSYSHNETRTRKAQI
jgi:hypothetical protein